VAVLEEVATRKWSWHHICLQNGEQAADNMDKHRLNGEPRLAAGEAADDGGRHGESDWILRFGFFAETI